MHQHVGVMIVQWQMVSSVGAQIHLGDSSFHGAAATRVSLVTKASCLTWPFFSPISLRMGRMACTKHQAAAITSCVCHASPGAVSTLPYCKRMQILHAVGALMQ